MHQPCSFAGPSDGSRDWSPGEGVELPLAEESYYWYADKIQAAAVRSMEVTAADAALMRIRLETAIELEQSPTAPGKLRNTVSWSQLRCNADFAKNRITRLAPIRASITR
jgi:hypothetical protein